MKSSKVFGGLIAIIFFVILFSGLSSAGPIESFDAANSCFCKSEDLGVFGAILCNLEKTLYIFFNTSLQCYKGTPPSSAAGSFDGGGGVPSKAAAAGPESGSGKEGDTCENSLDCQGDLVCVIYKNKNPTNKLRLKGTKLKSGEIAKCSTLKAERINQKCSYDKECSPYNINPVKNEIKYCSAQHICTTAQILNLPCHNPGTGSFCNATLPDGTSRILNAYICDPSTNRCIPPGFANLDEACFSNEACSTGLCQNGKCIACKSNDQCGKDMFCENGSCKEKFKAGSECTSANQCLSGICKDNHCKPKEVEEKIEEEAKEEIEKEKKKEKMQENILSKPQVQREGNLQNTKETIRLILEFACTPSTIPTKKIDDPFDIIICKENNMKNACEAVKKNYPTEARGTLEVASSKCIYYLKKITLDALGQKNFLDLGYQFYPTLNPKTKEYHIFYRTQKPVQIEKDNVTCEIYATQQVYTWDNETLTASIEVRCYYK